MQNAASFCSTFVLDQIPAVAEGSLLQALAVLDEEEHVEEEVEACRRGVRGFACFVDISVSVCAVERMCPCWVSLGGAPHMQQPLCSLSKRWGAMEPRVSPPCLTKAAKVEKVSDKAPVLVLLPD
jgi:hypothetical protein